MHNKQVITQTRERYYFHHLWCLIVLFCREHWRAQLLAYSQSQAHQPVLPELTQPITSSSSHALDFLTNEQERYLIINPRFLSGQCSLKV